MSSFKKARRLKARSKTLIMGPSGAGKTEGALALGTALARAEGGRAYVIDSENERASMYADKYDFDVCALQGSINFVKAMVEKIDEAAADPECKVIIIESLSHAWENLLDRKNDFDKQGKGNSYTNWRSFTKEWDTLMRKILDTPKHFICTSRSKQAYVLEEGTNKVKKVGLAPQVREGTEYEFSIVFEVSQIDHRAVCTKDNTGVFSDTEETLDLTGKLVFERIAKWCDSGFEVERPSDSTNALLNELASLYPEDKQASVRTKIAQRRVGGLNEADALDLAAKMIEGLGKLNIAIPSDITTTYKEAAKNAK